jgi:putative addiction module component (TIGR02574 family)
MAVARRRAWSIISSTVLGYREADKETSMTRSELVGELLKLASEERLQAAEELWESLLNDPQGPFELSEEQAKELERRMADHERDPTTAIPWEVVRAELLARLA